MNKRPRFIIEPDQLDLLFQVLTGRGYRLIGPTLADGAIVYDEIHGAADLPAGWTDDQSPGFYRIKKRDDAAMFGYAVGPHSWKRFLHVPRQRLWQAKKTGNGIEFIPEEHARPNYAFIGVRSCELHAIAIQDQVFLGGPYSDDAYKARRQDCFILAVNCTQPSGVCFCVSMNTGPKVDSGYDLSLTEVVEDGHHYFILDEGSDIGSAVLHELNPRKAALPEQVAAEKSVERAANSMGRRLDTENIKDLLYRNYESAHWDEVAARCLTCGNCTMVCPTCFCTTVEDVTDLDGDNAERWRNWDSCFSLDFSYIHGGSLRVSAKSRYRQWMVHKLAAWIDQFGTSGCVGCGRCIAWCPVGIDITEEAKAIRQSDAAGKAGR
ncbi:MAG TPA: 4Fe-4S dicluster domain-containing protein [Blastocatellia bacterium]|nr:4Fe-4S dicluster domain-containing protein [Blastocatellia bacterium]